MTQIEKPASVIKEERLAVINHFMTVLGCKTVDGLIDMCDTIIKIAKSIQ